MHKSVYVAGIEVNSMFAAPPDPTVEEAIKVNVFGKTITLPFVIGLVDD